MLIVIQSEDRMLKILNFHQKCGFVRTVNTYHYIVPVLDVYLLPITFDIKVGIYTLHSNI